MNLPPTPKNEKDHTPEPWNRGSERVWDERNLEQLARATVDGSLLYVPRRMKVLCSLFFTGSLGRAAEELMDHFF
jgi:hypothetical protein